MQQQIQSAEKLQRATLEVRTLVSTLFASAAHQHRQGTTNLCPGFIIEFIQNI